MVEIPTLQIKGLRLWRFLSIIPGIILGIFLIKKYKIKKIIGVYQDEGSLLTSYFISKLVKVDYFPYFMDLYKEYKRNNWQDKIADYYQPKIFKSARKVFCLTEGMHQYYLQNYNLNAVWLPFMQSAKKIIHTRKEKSSPFRIIFSGTVNDDRLYTLQLFIKAIENNKSVQMVFLSPQNKSFFINNAIWREDFEVKFCSNSDEILSEMANCDLVYLPITYKTSSNNYDNLKTCFGTKNLEYLQSGIPILVHSPKDFYNFQFYKKYECGYTLDTEDILEINEKLETIIHDSIEEKNNLVSNSFKTLELFSTVNILNRFYKTTSINE